MGLQRVLIAEEDRDVAINTERALVQANYEVLTVHDGTSAHRAIDRESFAAAILDFCIPPPSGLEVLSELRLVQPSCRRILTSARLTVSTLIDAINRGEVHRVLPKPYDKRQLLAVLDETLREAQRTELLRSELIPATMGSSWREALTAAIVGGHLRLALQPIVRRKESRVVGYEALLRSSHPAFSTAVEVMQAALVLDMLSEVGAALSTLAAEWVDRFPAGVDLFMNLHPEELSRPDGLRKRIDPLRSRSQRVVFEITVDPAHAPLGVRKESVDTLHNAGFRLAVDDMGSAYSTLRPLAVLQPAFIKMNMSLIRDIDRKPHMQKVVRLLSRFAESSGAIFVGKGVESEEEALELERCGVELFQGFHFGRPSFSLLEDAR